MSLISRNTQSFEELESGLAALSKHYCAIAQQKQHSLMDLAASLNVVAQELGVLKARQLAHLKATKGRFNLFTVLRSIGDETSLHSRWLAYLLNPESSHDCGTLFLRLFLDTVKAGVQPHSDEASLVPLELLESFDFDKVTVRPEACVPEGRLDILIESPSWGMIAIENKIWAGEQPKQLARYGSYLARATRSGRRNWLLLYLTPEGKPSATADEYENQYHRISYRAHILAWLEECKRSTYQHININQALQQYTTTVAQIIGASADHEFMQQIIELLKQHPSIISHIDEIKSAVEKLREACWKEFFAELRRQLTERGVILNASPDVHKDAWSCHWFTEGTPIAHLSNGTRLPMMIEWNRGCQGLRIGIGLHRDNARSSIWKTHRQQFAAVRERLCEEGFFPFEAGEWWPVGGVTLIEGFMSNEYVAAQARKEAEALRGQVTPIVDNILAYFSLVQSAWPQPTVAQESECAPVGNGSN